MKKISLVVTFIMALSMFLMSCSSSSPESAAEKLLAEKIAEKSSGFLKLHSFKVLDAEKGTRGVDYYKAKYEAVVECAKDGYTGTYEQDGKTFINADFAATPNDPSSEPENLKWGKKFTQMKPGDTYLYDNKILLVKHEQGWVEESHR